jgi:hypothetical protein
MQEQQMKQQHMKKRQMHEQQMHEQQMHEQQMHEQQMHEQQMHEQQMHEQQMHEQQMHEQQMHEQQKQEVNEVQGQRLTRACKLEFNIGPVRRPLASASKMVEAGDRIVLEAGGGCVENLVTGERMEVRQEAGVFVMNVQYEGGDEGKILLDSGAGVSVWPEKLAACGAVLPPHKGLRMIAASGSPISNLGRRKVGFRGMEQRGKQQGFSPQA